MHVPPTPFSPPACQGAEGERLTILYRLPYSDQPAFDRWHQERTDAETLCAYRLRLIDQIEDLEREIAVYESSYEALSAVERIQVENVRLKIEAVQDELETLDDAKPELDGWDPDDLEPVAEAVHPYLVGWIDKDSGPAGKAWPGNVGDTARLLASLPRPAVAQIIEALRYGYHDRDAAKKS